MKQCLHCGEVFSGDSWKCPRCAQAPLVRDGFLAFAPDAGDHNNGFRNEYFPELAQVEKESFWFCSRAALISWALRSYAPSCENVLEIGCGTGFMLSAIARASPKVRIAGSEVLFTGLPFAAKQAATAQLFQMDARRIPFVEEFDVIGAFDVLEHIQEDELVLEQMRKAVTPNGRIIVTVPQHGFLWSQQDEYAHHVRRYEPGELERKITAAGFRIELSTSFVSLLLPLQIVSRIRKRRPSADFDLMAELRISSTLNYIFKQVMGIERAMIRSGWRFRFGGSRLIVASKQEN